MSGKKGNKKKKQEPMGWQKEAVLIGILALTVLLFLSNFGFGGRAGNTISSFFFGLFGFIAYGFPILLFWAALFIASNHNNKIAWIKLFFSVVLLLLLSTFVELVTVGKGLVSLKTGYAQGYLLQKGGGVFGTAGLLLLRPVIGLAGAYVVTIAGIIISIIIVTERTIFTGMGQKSKEIYVEKRQAHRNHLKNKKEVKQMESQFSERHEEQKKRRLERKVSGVSLNPMVKPVQEEVPNPDEMKEIILNDQATFPQQFQNQNVDKEKTFEYNEPVEREKKKPAAKKENVKTEEPLVHSLDENRKNSDYEFPPISLLKLGNSNRQSDSREHLMETADKLEQTLRNFGVRVTVTDVCCGPSVTRYELQPEQGVKVSKIVSLADDIKLNLAAADIRIEAPIPGKAAVGIEVPNKENVTVMLRELFESKEFNSMSSKITFAAGKDIAGKVIVSDIGKMPHVLIAGATGSGKSVCINTIIMSILYKARPDEVKLIMIDPKVVELSVYNGIPHLMIPVVTDPKKAAGALHWAVAEMTERYQRFAECNVRDLKGYNALAEKTSSVEGTSLAPMPQIVIIVDELADLMMVAPGDVEDAICRLAQLARAAGIHLIIATQRPSVNVITGLIKANMPSRVAFAVSSGVDSRTILDMNGAEKLLGKGDMLFYPQGYQKPLRVQGAFVSDKEVSDVVDFLASRHEQGIDTEIEEKVNSLSETQGGSVPINGAAISTEEDTDLYFVEAGKFLIEKEKGSIGMLQRVFKIGFNRAARIMDQLEEAGVVGPEEGTKPRRVLMTMAEFQQYIDEKDTL